MLQHAADVLHCTPHALVEAITVKKEDRMFGRVPLNARQAANNRDSLAKLLYNELFSWIRDCINTELARDTWNEDGAAGRTIGLLDIFGFESFSVFDQKAKQWKTANSLEQLCINFANESLQALFNTKVRIRASRCFRGSG